MHHFSTVAARYKVDPEDEEAVDMFFAIEFPKLASTEQEAILHELIQKDAEEVLEKDLIEEAVSLQPNVDATKPRYAEQVLIETRTEEVCLDFSSAIIENPSGGAIPPIHTRIVMTPAGILRLHQALGEALRNYARAEQLIIRPIPR